jgi:hypothetical protein
MQTGIPILYRGIKLLILKNAGYTDEEIEKGDFLSLEVSDLIQKLADKKAKDMNNGNSQKVISAKEVKDYINKRWEYVNTLPGNKEVIIKLPSQSLSALQGCFEIHL